MLVHLYQNDVFEILLYFGCWFNSCSKNIRKTETFVTVWSEINENTILNLQSVSIGLKMIEYELNTQKNSGMNSKCLSRKHPVKFQNTSRTLAKNLIKCSVSRDKHKYHHPNNYFIIYHTYVCLPCPHSHPHTHMSL